MDHWYNKSFLVSTQNHLNYKAHSVRIHLKIRKHKYKEELIFFFSQRHNILGKLDISFISSQNCHLSLLKTSLSIAHLMISWSLLTLKNNNKKPKTIKSNWKTYMWKPLLPVLFDICSNVGFIGSNNLYP